MIVKVKKIDSVSTIMLLSVIYFCSSVFLFPNDYGNIYKISSRAAVIFLGIGYLLLKHAKIDRIHFLWAIGFGILSLFSILFSVRNDASFDVFIQLVQSLAISVIVGAWLSNSKKHFAFFNIIIIMSTIYCFRLLIYMNSINWGSRKISTMLGTNVNSIGLRLAIAASLSLYLYYTIENNLRMLYLILNYFFAGLIIVTGSRRALLLWIIAFLVFSFRQANNLKKKAATIFLVVVVLTVLYLLLTQIEELHTIIGYRLENTFQYFQERQIR